MPDAPRPYKVLGYPVIPAIFIIFCVILIINTLMTRPRDALIGLTLILLGIPFYFWFNRKNNPNNIVEKEMIE
jgi:APA family basic amino acid/polyamine antiporter